ncbi:uncharacterized protein LOC100828602 [Brachypodium distachyon]|uniref:Uncharacterized protein n=1 Tax=Brachypodium distachyon TaxID=15368 RepID=I1HY86_BRADI|nr:uncharacterized protein LOC100828602 [Brachypodium distachyon]KQJ93799.1 hypothetical protein BRADI_3g06800v3 [Brachypodium distachyon]|eukprot:XP_003571151.1 uncharacterized protein LOC100828602 [Brachypodium distachyon]
MGAKLSSWFNHRGSLSQKLAASPAPVRIIAADGSLKELPASHRVTVSDVLAGNEASAFFVCSSDALYFDQSPPALAPGELLQPGQIYFLLPAAALGRPLSSADMAAMAVRASAALAAKRPQRRHGSGGGKKKLKMRVVPVHEELVAGEDGLFNEKLNERTLGEFAAVSLIPAKGDEKLAAAAAARLRLKRALSIIQEDAE